MFLATIATEFILSEASNSFWYLFLGLIFIPLTLTLLYCTIVGGIEEGKNIWIIGSLLTIIFGVLTAWLLTLAFVGGEYRVDAQETVYEIEDEYGIEFKTKDFADKITKLTGNKPSEGNTYTLENLVYTYDDNLYSTDLTIVYSIDNRDQSVIELYSVSDAENLTQFDPAHGEPASAVSTQSKDK